MHRRQFLMGALAMVETVRASSSAEAREPTYDEAVAETWRPLDPGNGLHELVRAATLAPSSHNTQPWRFLVDERAITIKPDRTRRCPVVDPDDHHLITSLGCAAENIAQAAPAFEFEATPEFLDGRVFVNLERRSGPAAAPWLQAITARQSTRTDYDGKPLTADEITQLATAAELPGTACRFLTARGEIEQVLDYVAEGNSVQLADPALLQELTRWIRFNDAHALEHRDGLSWRCSGNPPLPAWVGRNVLPYAISERGENDKYARHIRSSAGIAVFSSDSDDPAHWFAVGRAYQRFSLAATELDIRTAFINQPVEVAELRSRLSETLGIRHRRIDLLVRFGRAPLMPRSLRRPVSALIDQD